MNRAVTYFDRFFWFGKENFIRDGNSYLITLDDPVACSGEKNFLSDGNGVLMVMDLNDMPGGNSCSFVNNSQTVFERVMDWPYEFSQRHIAAVSADCILESGTLTLNFKNTEQADGFHGIGFVSGSSLPKDE